MSRRNHRTKVISKIYAVESNPFHLGYDKMLVKLDTQQVALLQLQWPQLNVREATGEEAADYILKNLADAPQDVMPALNSQVQKMW